MIYQRVATICVLLIALGACDGGVELVNRLTTQLGAGDEHSCAEHYLYQIELNGQPADIRVDTRSVGDTAEVTERHWYPGSQMIVYYQYEDGGDWCNVWTEAGVEWDY